MIFGEQHLELSRSLRKFVDSEINPFVDDWERNEEIPLRDLFRKMGKAGFLGITKPEEFGGMGLDYSYEVVFGEEIGRVPALGIGSAIGVQTDMCTPALARFGSDELRREFLAPSIAGELIGCVGVSEEGAGSDVANVRTRARKDGGDYVITGSKMWISNGPQADWICLLCNTAEENGPHRNKSLIIVPMREKGVTVAKKLDKLGLRSQATGQLFFDEVRVPKRYRIGEEGMGFIYQMKQFVEERLFIGARTVSQCQVAIDDTLDYTSRRKAFGRSILDNQYVNFQLADMQAELESLRSMIYRAAETYVSGGDANALAAMVKLKAGKLANLIPSGCLQFWGGQGFMNENRISRLYRDLRLVSIGGGAHEIMLQVIAKGMMADRLKQS